MSSTEQIHVHSLSGCRPTPLAHYLKALGILRLVSEQADPSARGWWKNDTFHLATTLAPKSLESYFLETYQPTPMIAPWNGGSGFYPNDNKSGIDPIIQSTASRFAPFRDAIHTGQTTVQHLNQKPEKGVEKNNVIAECRRTWRGGIHGWIDAALALGADGECSFPAMLGTGGNDGRLDFTSNYMQRLVSLFDLSTESARAFDESTSQLQDALWASPAPMLEQSAIGQFFPGAAGGPNGSTGFSGGVRVNPWDFVLMLEGAILFRSGLARRCASEELPQAAAPFAVRSSGAGYGSSDTSDAGPRGEQWMPLWNRPATLDETKALFHEGRSQIARKSATRGTDMARSVARMGVTRGITSFERYGYIERNGLANLAVPLGRFAVRSPKNQDLLDEAAPWIDRLRRISTDKNAPNSLLRSFRKCEDAIFRCVRNPIGNSFLHLLIAMAEAEDQLISSPKFAAEKNATPIPWLHGPWMEVIEQSERSHEFRLARSLARQTTPYLKGTQQTPIREHWVPLSASYFAKGESGLADGPQQCATGTDLPRAAIEVMKRRLLMMENSQFAKVPLVLDRDADACSLADIKAFVERRVDQKKILSTARALMALQFRSTHDKKSGSQPESNSFAGLATYGLCRLAFSNRPIFVPQQDNVDVKVSPTAFVRLANGDLSRAADLAIRVLSNARLRPKIQLAVTSPSVARRIAASMIFGLSQSSMTRIALELTDPQMPPHTEQEMQELYFEPT
ncbi:type I-G CRISPR-associated protein Cas8g1/Csx17 [Rhodopirellula halodulae]|uniref:type I-G CRISPR-associated protein Cas8g1/Csx17 n=1 Tax=Rhodopirellula halodulae TaxID=2894198 RepID=UPI001E30D6DE|nr:type I-U CRISPR-associated protein Csx17 [Rhodopirellula sp. JC737]MCC9656850.1 type I-U CRISPR-associated protein Csx17 [Rhodopirellula sp. JC737]